MKKKYFGIGFISGIVFVIVVLVAAFFIIQKQSEKSVSAYAAQKDVKNAEMEIFVIDQQSLDSLYFHDIERDENLYISQDSNNFTFINYWATWCIPCVGEMPEFASLIKRDELKTGPMKFIFASQEDEAKIQKFEKSKSFGLPYFLFDAQSQPAFINHSTIPTSYVIDERNLLVYRFSGLQPWDSAIYRKLLINMK